MERQHKCWPGFWGKKIEALLFNMPWRYLRVEGRPHPTFCPKVRERCSPVDPAQDYLDVQFVDFLTRCMLGGGVFKLPCLSGGCYCWYTGSLQERSPCFKKNPTPYYVMTVCFFIGCFAFHHPQRKKHEFECVLGSEMPFSVIALSQHI